MNITSLKSYLTLNDDGSVNHKETFNKLLADITEFELREKEDLGLSAKAVKQVFDQYSGATLNITFILSSAAKNIGATLDNFEVMEKAIRRFVKANTGEKEVALFGTAAGKGYWRWLDKK